MRETIDFDYVPDEQRPTHDRLLNWSRWVTVRPHGWAVAPMFKQAQSNSRQWHAPDAVIPVDTLDAVRVEKAVSAMPRKHRDALRWHYVHKHSPIKAAHSLAVSKSGLYELVVNARYMLNGECALHAQEHLRNRLNHGTNCAN